MGVGLKGRVGEGETGKSGGRENCGRGVKKIKKISFKKLKNYH